MRDSAELAAALARSRFRSRFRLNATDAACLGERGLAAVLAHAATLIADRLAPAEPANDGRQTPMRGHPVFVAQHATATCCRSCLARWHGIPQAVVLDPGQQAYVVRVIGDWLRPRQPPRNQGRFAFVGDE